MATFRKRGDTWRAEIVRAIDGKRIRISETFPTKAHAQAWATEKEAELLGIVRSGATGRIALPGQDAKTLHEALTRYRDEVSPTKKGARWEVLRINAILRDFPDFTSCQLPKLTPERVAAWRDDRIKDVAASTVNREMILLSSIISHTRREWQWITTNPVSDVRKPSLPRPRDQRISNDDATAIAAACGFTEGKQPNTLAGEVGLMFLLSIETGMRAGEMTGLAWHDIHHRHLTLRHTKNGDQRDVPLSPRAVELMELMKGRDKHRIFTVSDASRDVLFRKHRPAHLGHIHFHDARHEAVTRLSKKLDVLQLARMIGHRDLKSLMIYYNEHASDIAARL